MHGMCCISDKLVQRLLQLQLQISLLLSLVALWATVFGRHSAWRAAWLQQCVIYQSLNPDERTLT